MPPRLDLLSKRRSSFGLPILPFLAFRVFTPWQRSVRSSHSGPRDPTKAGPPGKLWDGNGGAPQQTFEKPPELRHPRRDVDSHAQPNLDLPLGKTPSKAVQKYLGGTAEYGSQVEKTAGTPRDEGEFRAKYEEKMGEMKEKGSSASSSTPVRRVEGRKKGYDDYLGRTGVASSLTPIRRVEGRKKGYDDYLGQTGVASSLTPIRRVEGREKGLDDYLGRTGVASSVTPIRRVEGREKGFQAHLRRSGTPIFRPKIANLPQPDQKTDGILTSEAPDQASKVDWMVKLQSCWLGLKRKIRHFEIQKEVRGFPSARVKFVRLAPEGDLGNFGFSSSWNYRFSILNARYDGALKGCPVMPRSVKFENPQVSEHFIRDLVDGRESACIQEKWREVSSIERSRLWPDVMLATLEDYPRQALALLRATYIPPYPFGYAVSDSLDFIVCHYRENQDSYGAEFLVDLLKAIRFFLIQGPLNHVHILQRTLHFLLDMICFDKREWKLRTGRVLNLKRGLVTKSIYRTLVEVGHPIHKNTLLQFASGLVEHQEVKTACEILQRLKDEGHDFNSPRILKLCSTLLQRAHPKIVVEEGGEPPITPTDIFRFMLEAGTEPNIITHTILIKSALDVGDHKTAWHIHEAMIENGPEPDAHLYSILLNDSKLRMDLSAIRAVIEHVRQKRIRNSWIATDVLHATLLLYRQERQTAKESGNPLPQQEPAFNRLLQAYCDNFHIGPLAQLIPNFMEQFQDLIKEAVAGSQDHLLDPSIPSLVIMIEGFLDNPQTSYPVKEFYEHFRSLVLQNDPVVAPMTKTTHVYNLVLMAFSRFPERLADCIGLIGDMLPSPGQASTLPQPQVPDKPTGSEDIGGAVVQVPLTPEDEISKQPNPEESQLPATPEAAVLGPSTSEDDNPEYSPDSWMKPATSPITPPRPDVYTWSILLGIFMGQHQPIAAEKALTMMSERGIEPSQVTWNILAMGYARMKDPAMTVDVLRRMEDLGFKADEYTMIALGMIENRRALIDAMTKRESDLKTANGQRGINDEDANEEDVDSILENIWGDTERDSENGDHLEDGTEATTGEKSLENREDRFEGDSL